MSITEPHSAQGHMSPSNFFLQKFFLCRQVKSSQIQNLGYTCEIIGSYITGLEYHIFQGIPLPRLNSSTPLEHESQCPSCSFSIWVWESVKKHGTCIEPKFSFGVFDIAGNSKRRESGYIQLAIVLHN